MLHTSQAPIGIFDSGIGGLTVARAIANLLPQENLLYYGDTAHLPYGDKSTAAIQSYTLKIASLLKDQACKLIVNACHTASTATYELLPMYMGKLKVINMVDPAINYIREHLPGKHIGLIGTGRTVASGLYQQKLAELANGTTLAALATPLLVPAIEMGGHTPKCMAELVSDYLSNPILADIQALVLGCTHYPLIKEYISAYYGDEMRIIDPAELLATTVHGWLQYTEQLHHGIATSQEFYVSAQTPIFSSTVKALFGDQAQPSLYQIDD